MRNLLTLTPIAAAGAILQKTRAFSLGGACAVLAIFCFSAILHAQNTASIVGAVHDSSGASVVGAAITVHNVDSGTVRTGVTNDSGLYEVPSLPIGRYTLSATQNGFKQAEVPSFVLQAGQQARIDLSLVPGAATESVTVTDVSPLIQTDTSSVGQVIAVQHVLVYDRPLE